MNLYHILYYLKDPDLVELFKERLKQWALLFCEEKQKSSRSKGEKEMERGWEEAGGEVVVDTYCMREEWINKTDF